MATVYRDAPEFLKRAYNQAFFKRLWITSRREAGVRSPSPAIEVELAQPYDVLLAPGFATQARAEAERLRQVVENAEDGPPGPSSAVVNCTLSAPGAVSIFEDLAEGMSQRSKQAEVFERIRKLHAKRFGA